MVYGFPSEGRSRQEETFPMPRITAVLGVWIAVLFAIGFNIAHYPIVGEILAPATAAPNTAATSAAVSPAKPSQPTPATQPSEAASSADRAAPSDTEAATDRAAPSEAPETGVEKPTEVAAPTSPAPPPQATADSAPSAPVAAIPAAKYAAGAETTAKKPTDATFTAVSQTVVPATPPTVAAGKLRRLPPVDQVRTPQTASVPRPSDGRIPVYATTGID